MKSSKVVSLFVLLFAPCCALLHAQDIKKKLRQKAAGPKQTFATITDTTSTVKLFLFPEFYHFWPVEKNDTVLKYECYNANSSLVNVETIRNIAEVQRISFVKSFINYTHTYIDPEGKPKPSTVTTPMYRYDRVDTSYWKGYDLSTGFVTSLLEHKNEIVRTDTTLVTDPATQFSQYTIRRYYRVEELKRRNELTADSDKE